MSDRTIAISGAAGAWGDSSLSTTQLIADGRSDYIIYEGLAEITMAILSRAHRRDPGQGYARDIIETIAANLSGYRQIGARVITNAGGVNPTSACEVLKEAAPDVRVAVVSGDDLGGPGDSDSLPRLSGEPISVNAYLGARPIAAALTAGAEVVVTGRVVDSALALGPLIHEFGWAEDRFDLLSAGSLAGHLLECGPQSTGGLLTDWEDTPTWANPGFPIAEVSEDGSLVMTAPPGSDALVDQRSVTEQLLYEIGDPARYVLPDVVCDWSHVRVEAAGPSRVSVTGARGLAPPPTLKACAQIPDGWRAQFLVFIGGREAVAKARRAGRDLLERGERMLAASGMGGFRDALVEVLGSEDTYGRHARRQDTREVVLRIAVHHDSREAVERFVREVPSIALAGPPGVSGGGTGLPRATPLLRLECFDIDRTAVRVLVTMDDETVHVDDVDPRLCAMPVKSDPGEIAAPPDWGPTVDVPLVAFAHGRSGDKGADVNVGIRARHRDFWPILTSGLTEAAVEDCLEHLGPEDVERHLLPGIHAVNFVLRGGLGSGGTASLRIDPQGKAVAQQLLDMPLPFPVALLHHPGLREIPELGQTRQSLM